MFTHLKNLLSFTAHGFTIQQVQFSNLADVLGPLTIAAGSAGKNTCDS